MKPDVVSDSLYSPRYKSRAHYIMRLRIRRSMVRFVESYQKMLKRKREALPSSQTVAFPKGCPGSSSVNLG
eukprot:3741950-Pyramimonas_sp.AAC.1